MPELEICPTCQGAGRIGIGPVCQDCNGSGQQTAPVKAAKSK